MGLSVFSGVALILLLTLLLLLDTGPALSAPAKGALLSVPRLPYVLLLLFVVEGTAFSVLATEAALLLVLLLRDALLSVPRLPYVLPLLLVIRAGAGARGIWMISGVPFGPPRSKHSSAVGPLSLCVDVM